MSIITFYKTLYSLNSKKNQIKTSNPTKTLLYLKLNLISSNLKHLNLFSQFLYKNFKVQSTIFLPNCRIFKKTLLKSPHVNKKSREQFVLLQYKRIFFLHINIKALEHIKFQYTVLNNISPVLTLKIQYINR